MGRDEKEAEQIKLSYYKHTGCNYTREEEAISLVLWGFFEATELSVSSLCVLAVLVHVKVFRLPQNMFLGEVGDRAATTVTTIATIVFLINRSLKIKSSEKFRFPRARGGIFTLFALPST